MSKGSFAHLSLPPIASDALKKLGQNFKIARLRRRESRKLWAQRLGVSIPTLIRLEQGDPGVGLGICATALWLMGRTQAILELADPKHDQGALEKEIREASLRYAPRRKN
ncbi:MAG: hypothetical protein I8H75_03165 [Myxococcaceae bacterium]|nr:hypothetical protein [Myxococcaceae bacterium]MBH2006330.1 hypothetical protein [Myxococcaceae bacterium]